MATGYLMNCINTIEF